MNENKFIIKNGVVVESTSPETAVFEIEGSNGLLVSINDTITGDTFTISNVNGGTAFSLNSDGNISVEGKITASEFIKSGGTSSQFLKADGSSDSSSYSQVGHTHPYLSENGGTVSGNLYVAGDLVVTGSTYQTHVNEIFTKNDYITLREGAVSGLANGAYAGIEAIKYDGVNNGRLVFDNQGWARVGDSGSEQIIATRISNPEDGQVAIWDANNYRLNFIPQSTFAPASGSSNYVQLSPASVQTGNVKITGSINWGSGASSSVDALGLWFEQKGTNSNNEKIRFQTSKSGDLTNYISFVIDPTSGFQFNTTGSGNGVATFSSTITSTGFIKSGSTDSYVLLGAGGHKAVSDFVVSSVLGNYSLTGHTHDDRYYTETESNARYLGISSKAVDSDKLDGNDSTYFAAASSLSNYSLTSHNHSGVYEPTFTKNTAFNKNFGTSAGTVAEGNDSRIVNGQTAFGWGNHAVAGYASASSLSSHTGNTSNPHSVTAAQVGAVALIGTPLTSGQDLNALTNVGTWYTLSTAIDYSLVNRPPAPSGECYIVNRGGTGYFEQEFLEVNGCSRWFREYRGGNWGIWRQNFNSFNLLNIGTTASTARTALELTGTVSTHNHNGTYALLAGSTSQAFSASELTISSNIFLTGTNLLQIFNRSASNKYSGFVFQTNGVWDWFFGEQENGTSNFNLLNYGGGIALSINKETNAATFVSSVSAASFTSGGNAVLHAGNYSSYALPLSGGVITGATYIGASDNTLWRPLYFRRSGVTGFVGLGNGLELGTNDGYLSIGNTSMTFVESGITSRTVIHSGNIGSQSVASAGYSNRLNANLGLLTHPGNLMIGGVGAVTHPQSGLFSAVDNSNYILTINRHPGEYNSQLGFSSNGNLYYRSFSATEINTTQPWKTIIDSGNIGSQSVNYAASAGTSVLLDGYGIGAFLRKGNVNTDYWNQGNTWAADWHGTLPDGLSGVYNYGAGITINSSAASLQFYAPEQSEGRSGDLWYRTGWQATKRGWIKVIHSENIGQQSVNYSTTARFLDTVSQNEDSIVNYDTNAWHNWAQFSTPLPGDYKYGLHIGSPDANYNLQVGMSAGSTSVYLRTKNGSYNTWQKIWTDGNLTNTLSNGYLPYWNGSSLVNSVLKSSTTEECSLTINNYYRPSVEAYYGGLKFTGNGYEWGAIKTIQTNPSASWINRMAFFTMNGSGGSLIERMSIDFLGNVGIGTASPSQKLDVQGNIAIANYVLGGGKDYGNTGNSNSATLQLYNGANGNTILNNGSYGIDFQTGGASRIFIANGGNVGIGTVTPYSALDVYVRAAANRYLTISTDDGYGSWNDYGINFRINNIGHDIARIKGKYINSGGGGYGELLFSTRSAGVLYDRMHIAHSGNIGIGYTDRSEKLAVNGSGYFNGLLVSATGLYTASGGKISPVSEDIGAAYLDYRPDLTDNQFHFNGYYGFRFSTRYGDAISINGANSIVTIHQDLRLNSLVDIASSVYLRSHINILNKAGSAWNTFATRNTSYADAFYDLSYIGTISANSYIQSASYLKGTSVDITTSAGLTLREAGYGYWNIRTVYEWSNPDLIFLANGTRRFRVSAAGNFDIGYTDGFNNNVYKLNVNGSGYFNGNISIPSTGNLLFVVQGNETGSGIYWKKDQSPFVSSAAIVPFYDGQSYNRKGIGFYTGDFEDFTTESVLRMVILRNGNVGIGYTDRSEKLAVNGSGYFNGKVLAQSEIALLNGGGLGSNGAGASSYPVSAYEGYGWNFTIQEIPGGQFGIWNASRTTKYFSIVNGGNAAFSGDLNVGTPSAPKTFSVRNIMGYGGTFLGINPWGGNVSIGWDADQGYKLAVNGSGYFSGTLNVEGAVYTTGIRLPYNVVSSIWGQSNGGIIQILSDGTTTNRWVRMGISTYDGVWGGGLTVRNDLSVYSDGYIQSASYIRCTSLYMYNSRISSDGNTIDLNYGQGTTLNFYGGTTATKMTVSTSGALWAAYSVSAPAFYHTSDMRLKNVVRPLENVLDTIRSFKTFYYTELSGSRLMLGMSAQEFNKHYAPIVGRTSEDYLTLEYDKISIIAMKAIQELDAIQKEQQKKISNLEDEIKQLKQIIYGTSNN